MTLQSTDGRTETSAALSGRGLACVRGERRLFAGLDLDVGAGEWLHVRGENGVGKTSLLRMLAGLSRPEAGRLLWRGVPIHDAAEEYHRCLFYLGHHDAVKEELTALENLDLAAALDGAPLAPGQARAALERFGLQGREDLPVRVLSAGQKRRVLLARLATRKAELWLLDEPYTALDAKAVGVLSALVGEHIAAGGMVVITSHQAIDIPNGRVLQL
jgi:heme exporter protein A